MEKQIATSGANQIINIEGSNFHFVYLGCVVWVRGVFGGWIVCGVDAVDFT